jgi:transposase-like protein
MEPVLDTLQQAIQHFSDRNNCREYLVARRWSDGVECPRCGSKNVTFLEEYDRWQCSARHDNRQFTAKTGTIFENSPLPLAKWLMAMWQDVNCKNGVSSYEVHRAIGVTQKTAWFMDHRIRHALSMGTVNKLSGQIEADETFIGGKARNMNKAARGRKITGTGRQRQDPRYGHPGTWPQDHGQHRSGEGGGHEEKDSAIRDTRPRFGRVRDLYGCAQIV